MGKRVLPVAAIAFAIAAALSPSAAVAAFPGKNGRIAYVGLPPGETNLDIFTVRPNGSGLQQLTDDSIEEANPSWSGDGRRLVFTSQPEGPYADTWISTMSADGGDLRRVVNSSSWLDPDPSFSPSGRRIVYTTADSIRTIRSDGTEPRRLLAAHPRGFGLNSPEYSPNGKRIAFAGRPRGRSEYGIWTMRRDGSHLRHLVGGALRPVVDTPDYSPNSRHIVFCRGCGGGAGGAIHRVRADGSHRQPVLRTNSAADPTYAPDGDRIVLTIRTTIEPYGSCSDLYTMSPNGSNRSRINNNCAGLGPFGNPGFAFSPSWQPLPRSR